MRYPQFLQAGGTIGFVSPSFSPVIEPYKTLFKNTQKRFKDKGYRLIVGDNCYASCGIGKSNTSEACGAEINEFFLNNESDIILSTGGGETMCEDLPFIDFEAIAKARPKWYMGYSDNTNLTFTLPVLCDTAAIYGTCADKFGMEPLHESIEDAYKLLTGEKLTFTNYGKWERERLRGEDNPLEGYNLTEPFNMRICKGQESLSEAVFEGRLIGGCLDCLANLVGTPFDKVADFNERYKSDGIIWFIESCELNCMSVRRALWNLDQAGWFKYVKGFIIGRPMVYGDEMMGMDQYNAVTGLLGKYNVPILMDVDLGHLPPMMPFISGACARVSATAKNGKEPSMMVEYKLI